MSDHADIQQGRTTSRPKGPAFDAHALEQKLFWSVPETAFMAGVSGRTVWRLMADPNSGFPAPRHVRGRTLLAAAEVLAYMAEGATR